MNKEVKEILNNIKKQNEWEGIEYFKTPLSNEDAEKLLDYINQLETLIATKDNEIEQLNNELLQLKTNIKDSIERHKETIQDTKDFYRPLEDTIYSGSTLIELAETHIEILRRGKE
jgi:arsenate reductase-like glutaredoxin family protein